MNILKTKYPSALSICGGDINDLNPKDILDIKEELVQIVRKPTRKDKILSVIITDMHKYYSEQKIYPLVEPDETGKGKPSDHSTPIAFPHNDTSEPKQSFKNLTYRPLPESRIRQFGNWITKESFEVVFQKEVPTDKVAAFQ